MSNPYVFNPNMGFVESPTGGEIDEAGVMLSKAAGEPLYCGEDVEAAADRIIMSGEHVYSLYDVSDRSAVADAAAIICGSPAICYYTCPVRDGVGFYGIYGAEETDKAALIMCAACMSQQQK